MRDCFPDPNELICGAVDGTREEEAIAEQRNFHLSTLDGFGAVNETRVPYDSVDKINIGCRPGLGRIPQGLFLVRRLSLLIPVRGRSWPYKNHERRLEEFIISQNRSSLCPSYFYLLGSLSSMLMNTIVPFPTSLGVHSSIAYFYPNSSALSTHLTHHHLVFNSLNSLS